jgi:hypothetical protein
MIKKIIKKIKHFYENEYEGSIEIEFSIYDVIALIGLIGVIVWWFLK